MSTDVTNKNGLLSANFDGRIIYASNDYGTRIIPVTRMWDTVEGVTNYTCPSIVAEASPGSSDAVACEAQFAVNRESGELTVKGFYRNETPEGEIGSGKKEPINPEEWGNFRFYAIRGRYLQRDKEGRLLPYWDWPEGGWIVWNEMAAANGLHFTYEPLYEDGREYFIMFDITDVQGNKYSSELLPITLSPAPVKMPEKDPEKTQVINWAEGSEITLAEGDGYAVYLTLAASERDGMPFLTLRTENRLDCELYVSLQDMVADGTLSIPNNLSAFPDAGEVEYSFFPHVHEVCSLAGIRSPHELAFRFTVKRKDTDKYLIHEKNVILQFADNVRPAPVRLPFMDAQADEQRLYEEDGLTADLTFFGQYLTTAHTPDDPYSLLTADFRVANASTAAKSVQLTGLTIGGVFFQNETEREILPGEEWIARITFNRVTITGLISSTLTDQPERMSSVSDVSAVFVIDGKTVSCPIALSQKGDGAPIVPEGDPVFENDRFTILSAGYLEEEYEDYFAETPGTMRRKKTWNLWIVNKTDAYQHFRFYDGRQENGEFLRGFAAGPSSAVLVEVTLVQPEDGSEIPDSSAVLAKWIAAGEDALQGPAEITLPELHE